MQFDLATKLAPEPFRLAAASEAGFRYAEFWLDSGWLGSADEVVRVAGESPMSYALHLPTYGKLTSADIRGVEILQRGLDCNVAVVHQSTLDRHPAALRGLDSTMRLSVENGVLDRSGFQCWAESNRWLTLDVEHLWKFTLEDAELEVVLQAVEEFLRRFGDKLAHVHLPGYQGDGREHRPMSYSPTMVSAVLALLARYEYCGLVVSEIALRFQEPNQLARDARFFHRWRDGFVVSKCG